MSLSRAQALVRDFQLKFEQDAPTEPQTKATVEWTRHARRLNWIVSEIEEGWDAYHDENIANLADAYLDVIYLALGGMVEMGVEASPLFDAIHAANMTKVKLPKTAKIAKPPGFKHPDIAGLIDAQRKR